MRDDALDGSLYQYFPKKAAVLAALHDRDANVLLGELRALLHRDEGTPRERFEAAIGLCFHVQAEAAELHRALAQTGVEADASPGFAAIEEVGVAELTAFLVEVRPDREADAPRLAAHVFVVRPSVLAQVGRPGRAPGDAERLAADTATMLADFLGLR